MFPGSASACLLIRVPSLRPFPVSLPRSLEFPSPAGPSESLQHPLWPWPPPLLNLTEDGLASRADHSEQPVPGTGNMVMTQTAKILGSMVFAF